MEHKINRLLGGVWMTFSGVYTAALLWNVWEACTGRAQLAVWHYPFYAGSVWMTVASAKGIRKSLQLTRRRAFALAKQEQQKAAQAFSYILGEVHGLSSLFYRNEEITKIQANMKRVWNRMKTEKRHWLIGAIIQDGWAVSTAYAFCNGNREVPKYYREKLIAHVNTATGKEFTEDILFKS